MASQPAELFVQYRRHGIERGLIAVSPIDEQLSYIHGPGQAVPLTNFPILHDPV